MTCITELKEGLINDIEAIDLECEKQSDAIKLVSNGDLRTQEIETLLINNSYQFDLKTGAFECQNIYKNVVTLHIFT